MQCPQCRHENPPNVKFCHDCGTALARRCPNCQTELASAVKFCGECGSRVQPAAPTPTAAPDLPPVATLPAVAAAAGPPSETARPPNRLGVIDWLLIGTLLPVCLFGAVMSVVHGVRGDFVRLPFTASSAPDEQSYPIVRRVVSAPGAEPASVAVGDRVLRLQGSDLRGLSLAALVLRSYAAAPSAHSLLFTFERGGVRFDIPVRLLPGYNYAGCPWWATLPLLLVYMGNGLLLLVRGAHWHLARRYYVVTLLFASTLVPYFGSPTAPRIGIARGLLLLPLTYGLTLWLICDFQPVTMWGHDDVGSAPESGLSADRHRRDQCETDL